jgi:Bifunctional DNA primase/polymerase, N-terminal/AAA domain
MSSTYSSTDSGPKQASAKDAWLAADPFPIASNTNKLKVAVSAAMNSKSQLQAALAYAEFGVPVLPCNWIPEQLPDKTYKLSKRPMLGPGGLYLATTDPILITEWWTKWPKALIGVPAGRRTGLWFLDADSKEGHDDDGLAAWDELNRLNSPSSDTRSHKTGTNGLHDIFKWNPERPVQCSKIAPGLDVKGEGGYVIVPPSPYELDGEIHRYGVTIDSHPEPAPDWLYDRILGQRSKSKANGHAGGYEWAEGFGQKKLDEICEELRTATIHHWDEATRRLWKVAKWIGGGAYDIGAARDKVIEAAKQNPTAPSDYIAKVRRSFTNGVADPEPPPENGRVEILPPSQWMGEAPATAPPALVKGVLPQTGVAVIGGQSGGGKTFHALHLAARLIPDCNELLYINKYHIKRRGGVLYFVLEGKPAFPLRVRAAFEELLDDQLKFGDRYRLPFAWNTYEPHLYEKEPDGLLKLAERDAGRMRTDFGVDLVAIFLDTMGLAACYENEDKAAQVQKVVSRLNRLSDITGALVIGVDHYGKDQGAGLRGSSAKRGHVETILACLVDRDKNEKPINHRLFFEKIRDGEEGGIIRYRLRPVDMGVDEDGDRITTCVVQWEPHRVYSRKERQPPKKKQTDVNLERAIKEVGLPADAEVLRAAFYKYHGGNAHAANVAWNRAINNKLDVDGEGRLDYAVD